jgi:deoxyribodipyrimidine photo-lyase
MYTTSVFIFRRDLRIQDNRGLIKALKTSKQVIPCFIVNPQQVGPDNHYRSMHALQFMAECLAELDAQLRSKGSHLYLFYGHPEQILTSLVAQVTIDAVFVNKDYTPYSRQRDATIEELCNKNDIAFISEHDVLLNEPESVLTGEGKPYQIFTPFYKASRKREIPLPEQTPDSHYYRSALKKEITLEKAYSILVPQPLSLYVGGGRSLGLSLLKKAQGLTAYETTRNTLSLDTSLLSGHNKFGTVSIREVYHALSNHPPILTQLYWRDFFYHVASHTPRVFGHAFREKFDQLPWSNNVELFKRWCEGTTGVPVVDAGMRQLRETGFMHNRARLITASFLIKDLHIDWQWGEQYFAQRLLDYDPCVNNGNWQWVASTGCDHQPYFRIFNPWLQQKRFDPECIYIKRWVPELRHIDPHTIETWYKQGKSSSYPRPLVDHAQEAALTKTIYKRMI